MNTAAILQQDETGQFVLVGGSPYASLSADASDLSPPGPGQLNHDRLVSMGLTVDCLLLAGSVYLLTRTHRAKLPQKHPLIWARTFLQVLEWLYFL